VGKKGENSGHHEIGHGGEKQKSQGPSDELGNDFFKGGPGGVKREHWKRKICHPQGGSQRSKNPTSTTNFWANHRRKKKGSPQDLGGGTLNNAFLQKTDQDG